MDLVLPGYRKNGAAGNGNGGVYQIGGGGEQVENFRGITTHFLQRRGEWKRRKVKVVYRI